MDHFWYQSIRRSVLKRHIHTEVIKKMIAFHQKVETLHDLVTSALWSTFELLLHFWVNMHDIFYTVEWKRSHERVQTYVKRLVASPSHSDFSRSKIYHRVRKNLTSFFYYFRFDPFWGNTFLQLWILFEVPYLWQNMNAKMFDCQEMSCFPNFRDFRHFFHRRFILRKINIVPWSALASLGVIFWLKYYT